MHLRWRITEFSISEIWQTTKNTLLVPWQADEEARPYSSVENGCVLCSLWKLSGVPHPTYGESSLWANIIGRTETGLWFGYKDGDPTLIEWCQKSCWGKLFPSNLTRQMICYTEPTERLTLETVWKRAGWTICLSPSITISPCKAAEFARSRDHAITLKSSWKADGLNHWWFGHKRITWSLTRWILAWSCESSCLTR